MKKKVFNRDTVKKKILIKKNAVKTKSKHSKGITGKNKETERLQVYLSRRGVCSRRKAMDFILQGYVAVNGEINKEPSTLVDSSKDKVTFKNKVIEDKKNRYILLNKPRGYITTKADKFARKKVLDIIPQELNHLHPVGRLDKESEGLLLLTNDGDVTYKLTHPKHGINKTYIVTVRGSLNFKDKKRLEQGVVIDNKKTSPAKISKVKVLNNTTTFEIVIHEGRKRQIRLMLQSVGYHVTMLKRIVQGPLKLGSLKPGQYRELNKKEIFLLKK